MANSVTIRPAARARAAMKAARCAAAARRTGPRERHGLKAGDMACRSGFYGRDPVTTLGLGYPAPVIANSNEGRVN